ncbi:MAG: phosphomannose isomerase type II C-terminal cupin domain [bacterium]|nr:phosphomannose isomerase type II C-terminal cupin domain [bacterium]
MVKATRDNDKNIYTEDRPWGSFTKFTTNNEPVTVKIITVKAGQAFSLQSHEKRDEFWRIISGDGFITIGDVRKPVQTNGNYEIPPNTKHRIEAGSHAVVLLEISRGEFDENDIVRFEDKYGRVPTI